MKSIKRFLKHLFTTPACVYRHFSKAALHNIELTIQQSEHLHSGEIRFVVESALHPYALWHKQSPKQRALELFAQLGIWDTAHNNGVLIYLLLADRDVEIIADRGLHNHVGLSGWETICRVMEHEFRQGQFEAGVIYGIEQTSHLLSQHFPAHGLNPNELSDKPLIL